MELDTIVCGDCLDILPTIPDQSVDAVITDPPYPHIKRDYGTWTTEEWWALIVEGVVPEVRRILKPTGSAVFILQPNSEKVGKMRGWLWEFMAWVCREWNMVQDIWWWNITALPEAHSIQGELTRPSLKAMVWAGNPNCYRDQLAVLWDEGYRTRANYLSCRAGRINNLSHHGVDHLRMAKSAEKYGGVKPFNVLPIPMAGGNSRSNYGFNHGARSSITLMDWWLRYIVPPGGLVVDPFMGSGTTAVAAIKQRKYFFGCDTVPEYVDIANERIARAREETAQMELSL